MFLFEGTNTGPQQQCKSKRLCFLTHECRLEVLEVLGDLHQLFHLLLVLHANRQDAQTKRQQEQRYSIPRTGGFHCIAELAHILGSVQHDREKLRYHHADRQRFATASPKLLDFSRSKLSPGRGLLYVMFGQVQGKTNPKRTVRKSQAPGTYSSIYGAPGRAFLVPCTRCFDYRSPAAPGGNLDELRWALGWAFGSPSISLSLSALCSRLYCWDAGQSTLRWLPSLFGLHSFCRR